MDCYEVSEDCFTMDKTFCELFEAQADKCPDDIALVYKEESLTYKELNIKSNQLAKLIIARYKEKYGEAIKPDTLILLYIDPGLEIIISILATFKVGAAYIPVSPKHHKKRLNYIIDDANPPIIIAKNNNIHNFRTDTQIIINLSMFNIQMDKQKVESKKINLGKNNSLNDLAYIAYTSGTTGKPNGVMIEQGAFIRFLIPFIKKICLELKNKQLVVLSLTDYGFDIFGLEYSLPLLTGGTVILSTISSVTANEIEKADIIQQTPNVLVQLVERFPGLFKGKLCLSGGESLSQNTATILLQAFNKVINVYGPTETVIWSTWNKITKKDISIGKALYKEELYVLDENLKETPDGVEGELYIGGACLARGYLNQKKLTKEKFVYAMLAGMSGKTRLYKTGDIVRKLPNGNIDYIGRNDLQIKINGVRIELEEIEYALSKHKNIKQSCVTVKGKYPNKVLVAYYIPNNSKDKNNCQKLEQTFINDWAAVYDERYQLYESRDNVYDFNVWHSSFTNKLIPQNEMLEWLHATVKVIKGFRPKNILEIGCGVGLLLYKLIGDCNQYYGIDISGNAISRLRAGIKKLNINNAYVVEGSANQINNINFPWVKDNNVDTVVINSVIQMFPDEKYLEQVIAQSIELIDHGKIFIGDVRDFRLLYEFHFAVQRHKANTEGKIPQAYDLKRNIRLAIEREKELLISPIYFVNLKNKFSKIKHVEILPKIGIHNNEMNCFRYNVVLHVSKENKKLSIKDVKLDWNDYSSKVELDELLRVGKKIVAVKCYPNKRVWEFIKDTCSLNKDVEITFFSNYGKKIDKILTLEELHALANKNGYELYVHANLSHKLSKAFYDLVFFVKNSKLPDFFQVRLNKSERVKVSNSPALNLVGKSFITDNLKKYLEERLPSVMIPAVFVEVEKIPLTINGKIDRSKLPDISLYDSKSYVPPRDVFESYCCSIVEELLCITPLGINSDFFKLGGNSILAMRLITLLNLRFNCSISMKDIFKNRTILQIAKLIKLTLGMFKYQKYLVTHSNNHRFSPFALTNVQTAYLHGRLHGFEISNVSTHAYSELLFEKFSVDKFGKALNILIKRHDALRIIIKNNEQVVLESVPMFNITCHGTINETLLESIRDRLSHKKYDTGAWPLFNFELSFHKGFYVLHTSFEALIMDYHSRRILFKELNELYKAKKPAEVKLASLNINFRDYVLKLQEIRKSKLFNSAKSYWKKKIPNYNFNYYLPLVVAPCKIIKPRFSRLTKIINKEKWDKILMNSRKHSVSPTAVVIYVYGIVLSKWSGQDKVCINLTLDNRLPLHEQVNHILGDFTVLELFNYIKRDKSSILSIVQNIHNELWEDIENNLFDGIDFQRMARFNLGLDHRKAIAPIVLTSLLGDDDFGLSIDKCVKTGYAVTQTPQVYLDNKAYQTAEGFVAEWDYVEQLFDSNVIKRMHAEYCDLIEYLAETSWDKKIDEENIFNQCKNVIDLSRLQDSKTYEADLVYKSFYSVACYASRVAVEDESGSYTYQAIGKYAMSIACYLNNHGLNCKNKLIAVLSEKGYLQVVSTLGIMRSGSAYLPLHIDWPINRCREVLEEGQVKVILVSRNEYVNCIKESNIITSYKWLIIEDIISHQHDIKLKKLPHVDVDSIAYVIFTSGSTGKPKGVSISHISVANTIKAVNTKFSVNHKDKVLALSDLSFDLSVYDIFGMLFSGGTIVFPAQKDINKPCVWYELINRRNITIWNSVPQLMRLLIDYVSFDNGKKLDALRLSLLSGDYIPLDLPDKIKNINMLIRVISLGGATECSIWSIWYEINRVDPVWKTIPYGKAMPNQAVHVLNEFGDHCPLGVVGEIYIGGCGVALNYWQDKTKTNSSFINHSKLGRIYKTGDLGSWSKEGYIEFKGRKDNQVKINGYRVELDEISCKLENIPGIEKALVLKASGGLIAYLICDDREASFCKQVISDLPFIDIDLCKVLGNLPEIKVPCVIDSSIDKELDVLYINAVLKLCYELNLFQSPQNPVSIDSILRNKKIKFKYKKWLQRALNVLVVEGYIKKNKDIYFCDIPVSPAIDSDFDKLKAKNGMSRVLHNGGNLGKILLDDLSEEIYRENFNKEFYSEELKVEYNLIKDFVKDVLSQRNKVVSILDVGGGTGSLSEHLVKLCEFRNDKYIFADISHYFTNKFKETNDSNNNLCCQIYDLNIEPVIQGIKLNSIDIIIANDVLHNVKNIRKTLGYLFSILKPNGIFIFLDGTFFNRYTDITHGFIPGFNRFEDYEIRPLHPYLSSQMWKNVFHQANFTLLKWFDRQYTDSSKISDIALAFFSKPNRVTYRIDEKKITNLLNNKIPGYMLPKAFVEIHSFPLTAQGKIDVKSMVHYSNNTVINRHKYVEPQDGLGRKVCDIFAKILSLEYVSVQDDFFKIGGDSISAIRLVNKLNITLGCNLTVKNIFEFRIVAKILLIIKKTLGGSKYKEYVISGKNYALQKPFCLTNVQYAYLYGRLDNYELSNVSTHSYMEFLFSCFDMKKFESALKILILRHGALRTIVINAEQIVLDKVPDFKVIDHGVVDDVKMHEIRCNLSHKMYETEKWPLFDFELSYYNNIYVLHVSWEWLIFDANSLGILFRELSLLYNSSFIEKIQLPELQISFQDYMFAFNKVRKSKLFEKAKKYWEKKLPQYNFYSNFPLIINPEKVLKPRFLRKKKVISKIKWDSIKKKADNNNIGYTAVILYVYGLIISKWSGDSNLTINLTLFNRLPLHQQVYDIMGDFTVLELFNFSREQQSSIQSAMQKVHSELWDDIENSLFDGVDFQRLARSNLKMSQKEAIAPIVLTSILGKNDFELVLNGYLGMGYSITQTPQVYLDNKAYETKEGFIAEWDYVEQLFDESIIANMHKDYCDLIEYLALADWTEPLSEQVVLNEYYDFMRQSNETKQEFSNDTIVSKLVFSFKKYANNISIEDTNGSYTYGFIEQCCISIAGYLYENGFCQGDLIAVLSQKGYQQVVSILGTMMSGAAYLPLNVGWPVGRCDEVLTEGGVKIVLVSKFEYEGCIKNSNIKNKYQWLIIEDLICYHSKICIDKLPEIKLKDPAYVIFTSGSTGKPKGVCVSHSSVMNTIQAVNSKFGINCTDKVLALSDLSFDLSVYDIFGLLFVGGAIVFPNQKYSKEPGKWVELILKHKITIWNTVPQLMALLLDYTFLDEKVFSFLRLVLLSGDYIPLELPKNIKRKNKNIRVFSLGGATECGIWSIWYEINKVCSSWHSIPYGFPMPNQKVYILNDFLEHAPEGVTGEIFIGGDSLALFYWKNNRETKKKFIYHPELGRLYRTGDLGKWNKKGFVVFLGRIDGQVKINGNRVELGEISAKLSKINGVKDSVVQVKDSHLVCYISLTRQAHKFNKGSGGESLNLENKNIINDLKLSYSLQYVLPVQDFCLHKSYRRFEHYIDIKKLQLQVKKKPKALLMPKKISLDELAKILSVLRGIQLPDKMLPKYLYPSAGSSYAIRAFVNIPLGFVNNVKEGFYYYHPLKCSMHFCVDSKEDCFFIEFALNYTAMSLPYNKEMKRFGFLEFGHILELIEKSVADLGYGIGYKVLNKRNTNELLLARIYFTKESIAVKDVRLESIANNNGCYNLSKSIFDITKKHILFQASSLGYILKNASGIFVIKANKKKPETYIQAGYTAQKLRAKLHKNNVGTCMLGYNLQLDDIYTLAVGGISEEQSILPELHPPYVSLKEYINKIICKDLPKYMLPEAYIQLEKIPLTSNGKINEQALPEVKLTEEIEYVAPKNELESRLCSIWSEILDVRRVGVSDDFFKIGGDSILAIKLTNRLSKCLSRHLPVSCIFKYKTISRIAFYLIGNNSTPITIPSVQLNSYPLSFAQERLWFIEQYEQGTNAYHFPLVATLVDSVNLEALDKAIHAIVDRHQILRSVFQEKNGASYQKVLQKKMCINRYYLSRDEIQKQLFKDINEPFHLHSEYPIRVSFYHDVTGIIILVNMHHIACDGWSWDVFKKELMIFYDYYSGKNDKMPLPKLRIQYKDFSCWQKQYLKEKLLGEQLEYWMKNLAGYNILNFPTDYPRPYKINYKGSRVVTKINSKLSGKLRVFASKYGYSLYTLLLSGFFILLYKYTKQKDIIIGTPIANRQYNDTQDLIGFFANSVVLRQKMKEGTDITTLMKQVHEQLIQAQLHQDMPFEKLVEHLRVKIDQGRHPIFQILFGVQNFGCKDEVDKKLFKYNEYTDMLDLYKVSRFDMECFVDDSDNELLCSIVYATSLFKKITIKKFMSNYKKVLRTIVGEKHKDQSANILECKENQKVIYKLNNAKENYPSESLNNVEVTNQELLYIKFREAAEYVSPRNELEREMCAVWSEVLGVKRVGINDDFFKIGGSSILSIKLTNMLSKYLAKHVPVSSIFEYRTIARIATHLSSSDFNLVVIPSIQLNNYPLSFSQERLWFIEQYEEGTNAYHFPLILTFADNVDLKSLERSIHAVIDRHQVLRSVFQQKNGKCYQKVLQKELYINKYCVSGDELQKQINKDINKHFVLRGEYPIRVSIYYASGEVVMLINVHHIVCDAWSYDILKKEIIEFYNYYRGKSNRVSLPKLKIQYKDFSRWQRCHLKGKVLDAKLDFWIKNLTDYNDLCFPTDYSRPAKIDYRGDRIVAKIDAGLSDELRLFAARHGYSLYTLLLGGFFILLYKYTGQKDIVIGTPIANRQYNDVQNLVGFFANSVVLRQKIKPSEDVAMLMKQIHLNLIQVHLHQDLPFEKLVENLDVKRDQGRHPIFQIMFSMQNVGCNSKVGEKLFGCNKYSEKINLHKASRFDMECFMDDSERELSCIIVYATSLFKKMTIRRLILSYKKVLQEIINEEYEGQAIKDFSLLGYKEYQKIVYDWNYTGEKQVERKTIHELFQLQAKYTPDNKAILYKDEFIKYKQLNEKSNQLARYIRRQYKKFSGKHLKVNTCICLYLEKNIDMVIGVLAVLKAGGTYVPLDINGPNDRVKHMVEDTSTLILLTQSNLEKHVRDIFKSKKDSLCYIILNNKEYVAESGANLKSYSNSKDLAYVVYTSGTTGYPKGVMIEHKSFSNTILAIKDKVLPFFKKDKIKILSLTNYVFDIFGLEYTLPLLSGGLLILSSIDEIVDDEINECNVVQQTPAVLAQLTEIFPGLLKNKICFSGGEVLHKSTAKILLNSFKKVINFYGPTETTIWSTWGEISNNKVNIGNPLDNEQIYILDEYLNPVPIGIFGELYIGGVGIARGYMNNQQLTTEKFISNLFSDVGGKKNNCFRLYKTGDLARWLPNGKVEYRGRIDNQIKLNGFRIELDEIENIIITIPRIKQATVVVGYEGNNKVIKAYVVSKKQLALDLEKIKYDLRRKLPEYMMPQYFLQIDSMPLTSSGKINKQVLSEIPHDISKDFVLPRNSVEEKINLVWKKLLKLENICVHDNFFKIGGNSILGVTLTYRMKQKGLDAQVADVFSNPTIAKLALLYQQKQTSLLLGEGEKKLNYKSTYKDELKFWNYILSKGKRITALGENNTFSFVYNITDALLAEANKGYHTETVDLILSALSISITKIFGSDCFSIVLEKYDSGVEHLAGVENFDTTFFPIILQTYNQISETIIQTKETLCTIPGDGVGFSKLLLSKKINNQLPQIKFLYLDKLTLEKFRQISIGHENKNMFNIKINVSIVPCGIEFDVSSMMSNEMTMLFKDRLNYSMHDVLNQAQKMAKNGGVYTLNDLEVAYAVVNQDVQSPPVFVLPPLFGGFESYFNNIAKHVRNKKLILFNNVLLENKHLDEDYYSYEKLARQYCKLIMKLQPSGPYQLCGWSFGGNLAIEIAKILRSYNEEVRNIILIDSFFNVEQTFNKLGWDYNEMYLKSFSDELKVHHELNASTPCHMDSAIILFKSSRNIHKVVSSIKDKNLKKRQLEFYSYYLKSEDNYLRDVIISNNIRIIKYPSSHIEFSDCNTSVKKVADVISDL